MTGLVRIAAVVLVGLLAAPAPAADPPTPEQLVKDLASPVFAVREKATKALWAAGETARPALTAALADPDAEVAQRAHDILDKFDWGLLPDTPADVLKQIRAFRTSDPKNQADAVSALIGLGDPGLPYLRAVLSKHPVANRPAVFAHLTWALRHEVPRLIVDGKPDRAEALLALNALGPSVPGILDYAVFLHLRGRAADAVAGLEAVRKAGGPKGDAAANALVFVAKAAGDTARAKAVAKDLADAGTLVATDRVGANPPGVYESLLEDLGAWTELADRNEGRVNSRDGLQVFRLRLAGRQKEADDLIDRQKDAAAGELVGGGAVDEPTMALLLNDRVEDGIGRMKTTLNTPHILADVLTARLRLTDALDLLGGPKADDPLAAENAYLRSLFGTRRGRLLAQLGKRDAAAQVFGQVADQVVGTDDYAVIQLVRAEVRSGQFDLACDHLGRALAATDPENTARGEASTQDAFELLFEADADTARYWWRALRRAKVGDDTPGATMKRVRALLTGAATPGDLDLAVKAAAKDPGAGAETAGGEATRALALAAAHRAAGNPDAAVEVLAAAADQIASTDAPDIRLRQTKNGARGWVFGLDERFRFWVELGDLLSETGKHKDAAARLEQGWKRTPENPILLYLSGRALAKAGDEKEGRRRIDLSHWVSLGSARLRGRFLEELLNRGFLADAKRERDLVRRAGWVNEMYVGNVWNQVARGSVLVKDFDGAAAANRRAVHYLLRTPNVAYVEGYAYLTVPQAVRAYQARGLLAAGKVGEAVALAKECLAVLPGNSELVIGMVPELDKLGRTKEADELFRLVWDAYGAIARDNPDSAWARHSAAWVAAGCRRELDAALAFAKKASAAEPDQKAYKEGLSEVLFRRGDRDGALKLMKELAAADRRNHHYKRQLERYQSGATDSPLPDADDD